MLLLAIVVSARGADSPSAETRALVQIARDDARPWRARAGALRVLAVADDLDPNAVGDLVAAAEPAVLRRLALTACHRSDETGSVIGPITAAALADDDPGVRREALRVVSARPSHCAAAAEGVLAALGDPAALNRTIAVRATRGLGLAGVDVSDAAGPLFALLGDADVSALAAATLLLADPDRAVLREHREALDPLLRARTGPVPASLVLTTWAGTDDDGAWRQRLTSFAIEGSAAVRQGAHTALAWSDMDDRAVERHVRHALLGPDALIIAVALAAPAGSPANRAIRAESARRLVRHACPLVRERARLAIDGQ